MSREPDAGILTSNAALPYSGMRVVPMAGPPYTAHPAFLACKLPNGMEVKMNWNSRTSAYGDDAADRIHSFADDAKSTADKMQSRVSDASAKGADWASTKSDDLGATSRELIGSVSDTVSARPLLAVGIAILAGFVISRLLSRD